PELLPPGRALAVQRNPPGPRPPLSSAAPLAVPPHATRGAQRRAAIHRRGRRPGRRQLSRWMMASSDRSLPSRAAWAALGAPLLERWIAIHERQGQTSDGEFADGLEALAGIHAVQGDHAGALALYERVVTVRENDDDLDTLAVADTLEQVGREQLALGQTAAA